MTKQKIRVGIVGVGNCASALIQGVSYYTANGLKDGIYDGLMYYSIGGYIPTDIEFVLAYDVDQRKVGLTLDEAIFAPPNCARKYCDPWGEFPVVQPGQVLDGIAEHMLDYHKAINFQPISESQQSDFDAVVNQILEARLDVLINYLPVGSQKATEFYAECALKAGVPFLNCIPVFIASNPVWDARFKEAGIPIIGDDMKSMFGASILSQALQELMIERGHVVKFHSQMNVGGNTDFANMMNPERIKSKKISKENVIRSQHEIRGLELDEDAVFAGPSSFIPYLKDNKIAYFKIEAEGFGGAPVEVDIKLSVQDSENSAGVVIDAIRFLKVAHELGISGSLKGPSAWTQKTPPLQMTLEQAKQECDMLADRQVSETMRGGD